MTCEWIRMPDGTTAIACSRGRRRPAPCSVPGCNRPHSVLCDVAVVRRGRKKTCDAKLCPAHAKHVGPDRDACPAHAALAPEQLEFL